jgi:hypothetical protein
LKKSRPHQRELLGEWYVVAEGRIVARNVDLAELAARMVLLASWEQWKAD